MHALLAVGFTLWCSYIAGVKGSQKSGIPECSAHTAYPDSHRAWIPLVAVLIGGCQTLLSWLKFTGSECGLAGYCHFVGSVRMVPGVDM